MLFVFALETGAMRETVVTYDMPWGFYTHLEAGFTIAEIIDLGGSVRTFQDFNGPRFAPYRADYTLFVVARFRNLSIGAEHGCSHSVDSYREKPRSEIFGGYDRLFLRYASHFNPPYGRE